MASENGYKRITVVSGEEDDIVIQAGVGTLPEPAGSAAARPPADSDGQSAELAGGAASARDSAGVAHLAAAEAADEEGRREYLEHARESERRRRDFEMVTTEEDLSAKVPFAGMQRAIVVALLLLIAAAIVYWLFIRPLA